MSIFKGRLTFVLFLLVLVSTVQKSHGCSKVKVGGGGGRYTGTYTNIDVLIDIRINKYSGMKNNTLILFTLSNP